MDKLPPPYELPPKYEEQDDIILKDYIYEYTLTESLCSFFFCFIPFGIISLYHIHGAKKAFIKKNFKETKRKNDLASFYAFYSFIIGIIEILIAVIIICIVSN